MKYGFKAMVAALAFATVPAAANAQIYDWSGTYIGADVGWARLSSTWTDVDYDWFGYNTEICTTYDCENGRDNGRFTRGGLLVGGHIGYNVQWDEYVLGFEAELSHAFNQSNTTYLDIDTGDGPVLRNRISYLGSFSVRPGYAFDNMLVYAVAGLAITNLSHSWTELDDVPDSWPPFRNSIGYVAGLGLNYALGEGWSLRGEALYYGFGTERGENRLGTCRSGGGFCRMDVNSHIIAGKIGVSYDLN